MSVADNVSFSNFCQLLMKIYESQHDKKADILQSYIENWKKKAVELKKTESNIDDSFYPALRFLLPQLDKERGAYGVKEHTLAKIYIRILSLPKNSLDAKKFLEFRTPKTTNLDTGDFAEVAYWILKRRCAEGGQLSVEDINNHLDKVASKHASNDPRGVDSELITLLKTTSAEEQKWLIRILLKNINLGLAQNEILRSYHPDARELYDASNNLKKICEVLKDSNLRLHEIEIELFSPFKPMLSEECDFQKLNAYLKKSRYFFVETKLDGERFQLHMKNGEFKYFSRNGHEYTSNFGKTIDLGILTPHIALSFNSDVKSFILDGEMMIWNKETRDFASKVSHVDVKNLKLTNHYQPCFCIFDILLYNDTILTDKPLNYRLEILNEIFKPIEGAISFVSRKRVSSEEEIIESLNEAIDNREEGIVMKEFMSVYKPNVRKNGGWYKIKPEYISGLSDTLDLLIIGGYYGSGRHKGNISHFLLGVAVNLNEGSNLFYSVARVGSGYSMGELAHLQDKLKPHWNAVKPEEMPYVIKWAKEKPDVWIAPENSFILEVKAAEITSSYLFKTEYTLRFPRVERIRYDKSWKDCMSLEEFHEKRKMALGKLAVHHFSSRHIEEVIPKKKAMRSHIVLGAQYEGVDESGIEKISSLLDKKEICVYSGFGETKKKEVERKIIEFGGRLVQNPGINTFCILAETDSTVRIRNIIKCGSHNLIKTSWFFSLLKEGNDQLPEFEPKNFLAMSSQTKKTFSKDYDEYNDSYTILSNKKSIQHSLKVAKNTSKNLKLSDDEKYRIDAEFFSGPSPYSLFRFCKAYFYQFFSAKDQSNKLMSEWELQQIEFQFFGGQRLEHFTDEVTHLVVFSGDLSTLEDIKCKFMKYQKTFHVVTEEWIKRSIANKMLLKEDSFCCTTLHGAVSLSKGFIL